MVPYFVLVGSQKKICSPAVDPSIHPSAHLSDRPSIRLVGPSVRRSVRPQVSNAFSYRCVSEHLMPCTVTPFYRDVRTHLTRPYTRQQVLRNSSIREGIMDLWTDGLTDGRTDGRTDRSSHRGASEHLRINFFAISTRLWPTDGWADRPMDENASKNYAVKAFFSQDIHCLIKSLILYHNLSAIRPLFFCQTMRLTKSRTNPELKCDMRPLYISLRFALSKKQKIHAGVAVSYFQN